MCLYRAFYRGKKIVVQAETAYDAELLAAKTFKAKKSHEVFVFYVGEVGGAEAVHVAVD